MGGALELEALPASSIGPLQIPPLNQYMPHNVFWELETNLRESTFTFPV